MPRHTEVRALAEAVFRREHGRIIANLIRLCGSFDRAEEAMQEAFSAGLSHWTGRGVPDNPAAWITAAAYRKLIDARRRERTRRKSSLFSNMRLRSQASRTRPCRRSSAPRSPIIACG